MSKYQLTLSEEQLMLICYAVEDWHRFLCGQCELSNATVMIKSSEDMHMCREILNTEVYELVVPELFRKHGFGASYSWSGETCPNEHQRKAIAMSYGIYREILHQIALEHNWNNTYSSETLTCEEQGELVKLKKID